MPSLTPGDIVEVPHPADSSRMRIVITSTTPLRGRSIAYCSQDSAMWVSRIGAIAPIDSMSADAMVLSGDSHESPREVARSVAMLDALAQGIKQMSHALNVMSQRVGV